MLDLKRIKAVTLDLDDTLWPIWPTIERAERALQVWLGANAPMTGALFNNPAAMRAVREEILHKRPELRHDLSAVRREAIRLAMYRAKENPLLADEAFEVFHAERQNVTMFEDSMLALDYLVARYPLGSISNGNADLSKIGLASHFAVSISARDFGVGKPKPGIFIETAKRLGVRCDEILHVGDDVALDVLGALGVGMQAVWLNRGDTEWTHDTEPTLIVHDLIELCDALREAPLTQPHEDLT
jgi:FMN hydrolase / 5-amino-6-(5-phospho-D-ribitylamino)uracil phosphatase